MASAEGIADSGIDALVRDYETGHKAAREEPGKLRYFPNEIIVKFKKAARVILTTWEV